ncbi:hypothetical protein AZE42_07081, partial [Rhizopogon vesiculosus]
MNDIRDTLDGTVTLLFINSSYPFRYADPSSQPQLTPFYSWSHKTSRAHVSLYS